MNSDSLKNLDFRDPRVLMRVILGVLLLANLVAFYFVIYPLGGSPEELELQLQTLVERSNAQRKSLDRLRLLTAKVEGARQQAGGFEMANFTDRRVVYSTLVNEITQAAESSGIKLKDHALQNEEIEGSDTLGMITINANYEGTYGDLLNFVNRIDRSERFVIIDSLAATPQQGTNQLNVTMKMNLFVRNTPDAVGPPVTGKKTAPTADTPATAPPAAPPAAGATPSAPLAPSSAKPSPLGTPLNNNGPAPSGPVPTPSMTKGPAPSGPVPSPAMTKGPAPSGPFPSPPMTKGPVPSQSAPSGPVPSLNKGANKL